MDGLAAEIERRYDRASQLANELFYRGMNDIYIVRCRGEGARFVARVWRSSWRTLDDVARLFAEMHDAARTFQMAKPRRANPASRLRDNVQYQLDLVQGRPEDVTLYPRIGAFLPDATGGGDDLYIQDIQCFVWANGYGGFDQAVGDAFIVGYESVRPPTLTLIGA